jgi:mannosyl-3-phosphoglycerate phosphatase
VFSDLDGTLLDHETYRWDAAEPALDRLARANVPVVLASSKTGEEIEVLQRAMGLSAYPAIVENGAGVIGSGGANARSDDDYHRIRAALDDLPEEVRRGFTGFGDMDVASLIRATGLGEDDARRARKRRFSEPGLWNGNVQTRQAFITHLAEAGITCRRGGRFLTLSFGKTKADQMAHVARALGAECTMALGDAPNDIEMLEAADFAAIVHNPHGPALPPMKGESTGRIRRTRQAGPEGWNAAIHHILDHLALDRGNSAHG